MPTFRAKEIIDAREFTGGKDNAMALCLWVDSNGGSAWWAEEDKTINWAEQLRVGPPYGSMRSAYIGDWIVHKQEGGFTILRPQELKEQYEEV